LFQTKYEIKLDLNNMTRPPPRALQCRNNAFVIRVRRSSKRPCIVQNNSVLHFQRDWNYVRFLCSIRPALCVFFFRNENLHGTNADAALKRSRILIWGFCSPLSSSGEWCNIIFMNSLTSALCAALL